MSGKADGEPEYIAAEESQKKTELTEKVNEQSEAEHSIEYEKLDKPTGICGSGLLDAVHCLLLTDQIDDTGRMEETFYFSSDVFLIREISTTSACKGGNRSRCADALQTSQGEGDRDKKSKLAGDLAII